MKVGDLVKYRGWNKSSQNQPLALVIDQTNPKSTFHHRIRVMWVGEDLPIQASVLSTVSGRTSTWINPKYFEVVESPQFEIDDDPDRIWKIWGDQ